MDRLCFTLHLNFGIIYLLRNVSEEKGKQFKILNETEYKGQGWI